MSNGTSRISEGQVVGIMRCIYVLYCLFAIIFAFIIDVPVSIDVWENYMDKLLEVIVAFTISIFTMLILDYIVQNKTEYSRLTTFIFIKEIWLQVALHVSVILIPIILIFYGLGYVSVFVALIHIQLASSVYAFVFILSLLWREKKNDYKEASQISEIIGADKNLIDTQRAIIYLSEYIRGNNSKFKALAGDMCQEIEERSKKMGIGSGQIEKAEIYGSIIVGINGLRFLHRINHVLFFAEVFYCIFTFDILVLCQSISFILQKENEEFTRELIRDALWVFLALCFVNGKPLNTFLYYLVDEYKVIARKEFSEKRNHINNGVNEYFSKYYNQSSYSKSILDTIKEYPTYLGV